MHSSLRHPWLASAALLPLVLGVPGSEEIRFRSVAERTLEKRFVQHAELVLVHQKLSIEAPEAPPDQEQENPGVTLVDDETIEFTDETVEAGDGKPKKLKRSFVTIQNSFETQFEDEDIEDMTRTNKSGLDGKTVLFTWDAEEEEFAATWSGEEGDDELLGDMVEDADFRAWLPSGKVEEGDTWTIPTAEYHNLQEPSGPMGYRDSEAEEEDEDDPIGDGLRENLKGEIKATYKGTRDEDGVQVGVIAFEGKVESHGEQDIESEGATGKIELQTSAEIEGEILWDLKGGHFRALKCDAEQKLVRSETSEVETPDISFKVQQTQTFEGKKTYRFTCAPKE